MKKKLFLIFSLVFVLIFSLIIILFSSKTENIFQNTQKENYIDVYESDDKISEKLDMSVEKRSFIEKELEIGFKFIYDSNCDEYKREDAINYCKAQKKRLDELFERKPKLKKYYE